VPVNGAVMVCVIWSVIGLFSCWSVLVLVCAGA